jgi:hypothetical protein
VIVGVGHVARTGKDTFAAALVEGHGFTRLAFADALRNVAYESNPSTRTLFDEVGWEQAKTIYPGVRQYLIDLGTACRRHIALDVWIQAVDRQIEPGRDYVVTDVRYPNELEWLQARGGISVRVDRPGVVALPNAADQALVGCDTWAEVIRNDGTVDDLVRRAGLFVQQAREGQYAER